MRTSSHVEAAESATATTESRISTRVPSWSSIASSEREAGCRGDVLSIVDFAVMIAVQVSEARFAA